MLVLSGGLNRTPPGMNCVKVFSCDSSSSSDYVTPYVRTSVSTCIPHFFQMWPRMFKVSLGVKECQGCQGGQVCTKFASNMLQE